jgi:hypothetical protein
MSACIPYTTHTYTLFKPTPSIPHTHLLNPPPLYHIPHTPTPYLNPPPLYHTHTHTHTPIKPTPSIPIPSIPIYPYTHTHSIPLRLNGCSSRGAQHLPHRWGKHTPIPVIPKSSTQRGMYVYMCMCMCVYIWLYVMCICMGIYIYIYVHTSLPVLSKSR